MITMTQEQLDALLLKAGVAQVLQQQPAPQAAPAPVQQPSFEETIVKMLGALGQVQLPQARVEVAIPPLKVELSVPQATALAKAVENLPATAIEAVKKEEQVRAEAAAKVSFMSKPVVGGVKVGHIAGVTTGALVGAGTGYGVAVLQAPPEGLQSFPTTEVVVGASVGAVVGGGVSYWLVD
jgi:hypothetical protein